MFYSVLVAAYNAERYLDRCIQSVVLQSEDDFELIIVDDGSTDNSLKKSLDWQNRYPDRIRVVHMENQGSLMARRRCFSESKGQYIYILDADDYLIDYDFLKEAKKILQEYDPDLIFFNATNYDDKRPLFNYGFDDLESFENERLYLLYNIIVQNNTFNPLWNKIFKREVIDWDCDYEKYKTITNGTDVFQLISILFNCNHIIYWDKVAYYYRVDNNMGSIVHFLIQIITCQ